MQLPCWRLSEIKYPYVMLMQSITSGYRKIHVIFKTISFKIILSKFRTKYCFILKNRCSISRTLTTEYRFKRLMKTYILNLNYCEIFLRC